MAAQLRKDGQPKRSGGYRKESVEKNLLYKNLGHTKLTRVPESRIVEIEFFIDLMEEFPDRKVLLGENIFQDYIYSAQQETSSKNSEAIVIAQQEKIIHILQDSLKLPANRGGAIKEKIKQVLKILELS